MSTILKTRAGIGTLAYDTWELTKPDPNEEEMHRLAAKGWNHESLSSVADDLLKAATRLNEDVKKETKYWDQVLSFTEKGWSVFKIPSGENVLGVQIGATEAGLLFQKRGLVALRTNEDGSIKLHRHITTVQKTVRIRISKRGQITGSCRLPSVASALDSDDELEDLVRRARDSLFDQELYHEMVLEARHLLPFNVTLRDDVLHLPLGPQSDTGDLQEVLVDVVSVDESILPSARISTDDGLAELVAVVLRLLLSHAYYQRLKRRSQIPPPLTEQKRPNPPHAIIRPLLSHLHHHNAVNQLRTFLERVANILRSAGLTVQFDLVAHSTQAKLNEIISPTKTSTANESIIHALINVLSQPLQSTATFTLPSINVTKNKKAEENTISIDINTLFAQPSSGVEYEFSLPTAMTKIILGPDSTSFATHGAHFTFSTFSELTEYFCNILATDIVHNIMAARHPRWKPIDRTPPAEIFGSLERTGRTPKPKEMVCLGIELSDQKLELYLRQVDAREEEDEDALEFVQKQICVWNGSDNDGSFIEELKMWIEVIQSVHLIGDFDN
jgi:mediator of RNA polymerase II transcription subunit 17